MSSVTWTFGTSGNDIGGLVTSGLECFRGDSGSFETSGLLVRRRFLGELRRFERSSDGKNFRARLGVTES